MDFARCDSRNDLEKNDPPAGRASVFDPDFATLRVESTLDHVADLDSVLYHETTRGHAGYEHRLVLLVKARLDAVGFWLRCQGILAKVVGTPRYQRARTMHANLLAATLSAITLITGLSAQTQTRSDFIQGQDVTLGVTQAPPGVVVLHWLGFSGLGKGTCIPKPFDVCFDIPGSLILLATGVSDAQGRHELTFRVPVDAPLIRVASQQLLLDVTTLATTKSNAIDGPIDTIGAMDDDFLGSSLSPVWTVLDATRQTYSVANSELRMRPTKTGITAIWYQDDEGVRGQDLRGIRRTSH